MGVWFVYLNPEDPVGKVSDMRTQKAKLTYWGGYLHMCLTDDWMGLLSQFCPFRYFPNFSALSRHTLAFKYHIYIWQVSAQLGCDYTCQIWKWFKNITGTLHDRNFAYGEINERSFSNPHPCRAWKHQALSARTRAGTYTHDGIMVYNTDMDILAYIAWHIDAFTTYYVKYGHRFDGIYLTIFHRVASLALGVGSIK